MSTEADDYSYLLHWQFDLPQGKTLLFGHEYYAYRVENWWPAIEGSAMMGPNDYINIHDRKRGRIAGFAELQQQLNSKWLISGGVRIEHVTTETPEVQGYQDMNSNSGMGMISRYRMLIMQNP